MHAAEFCMYDQGYMALALSLSLSVYVCVYGGTCMGLH